MVPLEIPVHRFDSKDIHLVISPVEKEFYSNVLKISIQILKSPPFGLIFLYNCLPEEGTWGALGATEGDWWEW
mgnify:CR=1 FL=1